MYARYAVLLCGLALLAAGCSSTRQIQTAAPLSALPTPSDTIATADLARLTIMVDVGETALPDDIQAMEFRVSEIRLKPSGGDWATYPADINSFDIAPATRMRKTILATRIPPATYDSLSVTLTDVFVYYDANAGGPLTMPRDTPLVLPLTAEATTAAPTMIRLVFEPGASLSQDAQCRWYFLPFFDVMMGE